jgi:hypothetical protein
VFAWKVSLTGSAVVLSSLSHLVFFGYYATNWPQQRRQAPQGRDREPSVEAAMGRNVEDLTGRVFGKLRVLERAPKSVRGKARWWVYCDPAFGGCGSERKIV